MRKYNVGDIVKYADEWCSDGEKVFRFVVLENGLSNPCNPSECRYKIGCLNSNLALGFVDVVDECMIISAE